MTSPRPIIRPPNRGRRRMSPRGRLIFLLVAWAIVLLPFLFWRSTWFGRPLTDSELQQYLHDQQKPRHIQHALVQVGERIGRHDPAVARWYPDLVKLASSPVEEIRNTDAWIMGQDTSRPEFHQALLGLLNDPAPIVRSNAALSLVRFGDDSGHPQLLAMLQPAQVIAPRDGRVTDVAKPGTAIRQNGMIAKLKTSGGDLEVRAPIPGRVRSVDVERGATVQAGTALGMIDPGPAQVWEALRALYLVGRKDDLPLIAPYKANLENFPDKVREQAVETDKAILQRGR